MLNRPVGVDESGVGTRLRRESRHAKMGEGALQPQRDAGNTTIVVVLSYADGTVARDRRRLSPVGSSIFQHP